MSEKMSAVTAFAGALAAAILAAVGWVARRIFKRVQKERRMLYELYGFVFGAEEIDLSLDDDPVEDQLERGSDRFDTILDNQREIAEAMDEDVDLDDPRDG